METAVSHGAVYRALNKEDGPIRKLQSNFGFLQIEEYQNKLRGHRGASPTYQPLNNKKYVYDVLDWVIKKVLDILYFLFPRPRPLLSLWLPQRRFIINRNRNEF